jgi:sugar phosphate isomerase/epimerase
MLNELGIKQLAYDWRSKHIPSFEREIETLQKHNIRLAAVWLWIAPDSTGLLGRDNEQVIEIVRKNHVQTDFWVGFDNRYFENLTDDQKLEKASSAVRSIHATLNKMSCKLNLYNHGDWFGEPANEIRVLEETGLKDVGIVYNFHHAHQQVKDFPALLNKMLPYLHVVNINGMKIDGPKILPLGAGDQELEMLKTLKASGYHGPIGILGHVENKDVRVVLQGNLNGLKSLLKTMGDNQALKSYE